MGLACNGMGPSVVTWEGLRAWRLEMGLTLEPWEARTLVLLGNRRAGIDSQALTKKPPPTPPGKKA